MAADSRWNNKVLQGVFIKSLNEHLKDEIAVHDEPSNLDALISLANRLDNWLWKWHRERSSLSIPQSQSAFLKANHSPTLPTLTRWFPGERYQLPPERNQCNYIGLVSLPQNSSGEVTFYPCAHIGPKGRLTSNCGGADEPNRLYVNPTTQNAV